MFSRRILLLADLHIGSIKNIPYVYNTVTNIIDKELVYKKTDAVVFLGDYFHQLFKCNSEYIKLAVSILSYLMLICKKQKIKVRMIYGTESHDSDQYGIFDYFAKSPDFDFKVITNACSEDLFFNCKVLYLPEEYIYDKNSYYGKLLNKKYDYIFGHGIIEEGMPLVKKAFSSGLRERQVPHFKVAELARASKVCVFGHYHIHTDLGNNVFYLGSLFRDSFGEEEPKGYGVIENDELKFIENEEAYIYKTYTYNEDSPIFKDIDSFMHEWLKIKIKHKSIFDGTTPGKLRLVFNLPHSIDKDFKEKIKSMFIHEKCVNAVFKDEFECEDLSSKTSTEYNYVMDDSLQVEDKIHNFINHHYNYDLSTEDIVNYIKKLFKL